jgi:hypothetical protein
MEEEIGTERSLIPRRRPSLSSAAGVVPIPLDDSGRNKELSVYGEAGVEDF